VNVHGGGDDLEAANREDGDFAVDHDVDWCGQVEFHAADGAARGQRMLDVRAVVEFGQHTQKAEAADRSPTDEFDQGVGGVGIRRDQHGAAGVLAVVESEKEAAALVPILVVIAAKRESAAVQLRYANEDTEKIAERAERLEVTVGESCHVSGKSHTQQIECVDRTIGVR
jgi:hypothetical protein